MRIDAHMHFTPGEYLTELSARSLLPFPLPTTDPADALAFLDAHEIDVGVLSLSPPGVAFGDQALGDHLARLVNEATARTVAEAAGRFAGLAVLPLPQLDRALAELHHALDVLQLDGVVLLSNTLGRYPGDPEWAPLLDELDRRGAYVLVHPASPPYALPLTEHPAWVYEFLFETTRALASLITAGAPARWTRIRLQTAHLGGTIPFVADRLDALGDAESTRAFLRRLFYDTALRDDPATLAATAEFAGSSQVVFGSDWPYVETINRDAVCYARNASRLVRLRAMPAKVPS